MVNILAASTALLGVGYKQSILKTVFLQVMSFSSSTNLFWLGWDEIDPLFCNIAQNLAHVVMLMLQSWWNKEKRNNLDSVWAFCIGFNRRGGKHTYEGSPPSSLCKGSRPRRNRWCNIVRLRHRRIGECRTCHVMPCQALNRGMMGPSSELFYRRL